MDNLHPPCINATDAKPNATAFSGGECVWPGPAKWNQAVAPLREVVQQNLAPSFMGVRADAVFRGCCCKLFRLTSCGLCRGSTHASSTRLGVAWLSRTAAR